MPGSVVSVLVNVGDVVKKSQPLIIMEAMKMEHTIVAPLDGVVEAIYFAAKECWFLSASRRNLLRSMPSQSSQMEENWPAR